MRTALLRISPTSADSRALIASSDRPTSAISSSPSMRTARVRSPAATAPTAALTSPSASTKPR